MIPQIKFLFPKFPQTIIAKCHSEHEFPPRKSWQATHRKNGENCCEWDIETHTFTHEHPELEGELACNPTGENGGNLVGGGGEFIQHPPPFPPKPLQLQSPPKMRSFFAYSSVLTTKHRNFRSPPTCVHSSATPKRGGWGWLVVVFHSQFRSLVSGS